MIGVACQKVIICRREGGGILFYTLNLLDLGWREAYSFWASKQGHSLWTLGKSRWPTILALG